MHSTVGHNHACITCGLTEESIEIHDPMPDRGLFDVTSDVFGYTVRGKRRVLTEYCLIQW